MLRYQLIRNEKKQNMDKIWFFSKIVNLIKIMKKRHNKKNVSGVRSRTFFQVAIGNRRIWQKPVISVFTLFEHDNNVPSFPFLTVTNSLPTWEFLHQIRQNSDGAAYIIPVRTLRTINTVQLTKRQATKAGAQQWTEQQFVFSTQTLRPTRTSRRNSLTPAGTIRWLHTTQGSLATIQIVMGSRLIGETGCLG